MSKESTFHKVGTWLFYNRLLTKIALGVIACVVIFLSNWTSGRKHIESCEDILIDIDQGSVSGLSPMASQDEIKKKFPCYTGVTAEGSSYNEGGGVFCKHHELYFYTAENRIEIRNGYDGAIVNLSDALTLEYVSSLLGPPLETDARTVVQAGTICDAVHKFSVSYGTLILYQKDKKILRIVFESNKG